MLQNGSRSRMELTVDYVNRKADVESPTFTGTPKAPTPGSSADDAQIATVGYVKGLSGGGFIGTYLTSDSGGNESDSGTKFTSGFYASYTAKNDCFLCWHCIMDSSSSWARTPNCYIKINDRAISSTRYAYRQNVANDFYFQGPVRKGTVIKLQVPTDVSFHKYSWIATEFSVV